jgi:predicted RNA methylase
MSAYVMTLVAKKLGYKELVDIGSGDGRIAFCGKILGLISYSIEIDDVLVELQETISKSTNQNFNPKCKDALEFDYSQLQLTQPVFFIGGLSQMGGDILAISIINKINGISNISHNAGLVFAGTNSKKQLSNNMSHGGWGSIIKKHNLNIVDTVSLPTIWTFDQTIETPYIYTKFN